MSSDEVGCQALEAGDRAHDPDDFTPKSIGAENSVKKLAEVTVRSVVAMQKQAPSGFQHAMDLDETDRHVAEVRGDTVAVRVSGRVDHPENTLVIPFNIGQPLLVDIILPGPDVSVTAVGRRRPHYIHLGGTLGVRDTPPS